MNILRDLNWTTRAKVPVYMQSESAECGLTCLAMVSTYFGHSLSVAEARAQFQPSNKGTSLSELLAIAKTLNLSAKAVKLDMPALEKLTLPAVVHWNFNHFVVLVKVDADSILIHDPAMGAKNLTREEFSKHFTGVALQVSPNEDFSLKRSSPKLKVSDLLGRVTGFGPALFQVLFFALLLEFFGLAIPKLGQLITDEVLPNTDSSLLTVLGIGFLLLIVVRTVVGYVRDWALSLVSVGLKAQVSERVFRHTLKLPASYFERRRSSEIASRFESLAAIERTLASSFIEALLDGAFSIVILALLFSYSAWLGAIVILSVAVYALVRHVTYAPLRELEMRIVEAKAHQSGSLLETLRSIVPLQLANKTEWRLSQWGVHLSEGTNAELKLANANARLSGFRLLVQGLCTVVVTWVAASLTLDNSITLGALFAILAYEQSITPRLVIFIERMLSIRFLSVHLERLADIVYAAPQAKASTSTGPVAEDVRITVKDLHFRYSPTDPEILRGVNLEIAPGEHVAFTGSSGCGKSTLMKLLLGILEPTSGEILINGKNASDFGTSTLRQLTGSVLQDDLLFYGTIRDNISYFDPEATDEAIMKAANAAGLHREIMAMPMNYQSLVGEGSGSLSGGQRQRLFLARAIYREPKLLVLDEATSHLDQHNEAIVNEGIHGLKATRISVAHRAETLVTAERIVILNNGVVERQLSRAEFIKILQGGAAA